MSSGETGVARPRIFVHVGSPKTGTTFLQQVVWSQRDLAAAQGLTLPLDRFNDHFFATLDVRGLAGKDPHPLDAMGVWSRLVSASLTSSTPNVLISHELFAAATAEQAKRAMSLFGDADVHLVLTTRDLVRQITAEWQEHVKHRATMTLAEFVTNVREASAERKGWFWRVQDPAGIIDRWAGGLPADRVHVVTLPPTGSSPDVLWERFAGLLGMDASAFDLASSRSNTSLGVEQTEVLRQVNAALGDRLPVPGPYPGVAKDILAHQILVQRKGAPISLDADDIKFAVVESQRVADALGERGVDVVGSLDELVPDLEESLAKASPQAYDVPPAERLLDESVHALADLLVELSERMAAATAPPPDQSLKGALSQAADVNPGLRKARSVMRSLRDRVSE